jgi:integrase
VKPNGKKLWRYKYRIAGVENLLAIGHYPETSLKQARDEREAASKLVKRGVHPARQRKADKLVAAAAAANTFQEIAREWIGTNCEDWTPLYLKQVETTLRTYVYPHIGGLPIRAVRAPHLLEIVRRVAMTGTKKAAPTVAILIRQWCSAIFRYAVADERAEIDPTWALRGAVKRPKVKHKKHLTELEIPILLSRLDAARCSPQVKIALRLLLLTFVRPGELRNAMWAEFDLVNAEWRIPAERMKMRDTHIVPLSRQTVNLLNELKRRSRNRAQLFPNTRDPKRTMSITTLNRCLERLGYAGLFSAHGFRATASTWLNKNKYGADWIERQLAHAPRDKVRAAYHHEEYLDERKIMMQEWADYLDRLIAG